MFFALALTERDRVAELYKRAGHSALRRARQLLRNDTEAEDVVHEIFMRIAEAPGDLDRAQNPTAWLYGATTHACLNRLRNEKNRARILEGEGPRGSVSEPAPEARLVVERALCTLPEEQAVAFVYYHLDQMSHAEIAEVMGCSRRHVGNLLERAGAGLEVAVGPEAAAGAHEGGEP